MKCTKTRAKHLQVGFSVQFSPELILFRRERFFFGAPLLMIKLTPLHSLPTPLQEKGKNGREFDTRPSLIQIQLILNNWIDLIKKLKSAWLIAVTC